MKDVRLICIDIDGTLLNSSDEITPATHRELERLHAAGKTLALVTGRRFMSAVEVARKLTVPVVLGVHNGATLRRMDGSAVYRKTLGAVDVRRACEIASAHGGFPWIYVDEADSGDSRVYCEDPASAADGVRRFATTYYARNEQTFHAVGDLATGYDGDAIEVMVTTAADDADAMVFTLKSEFGERASVIKELSSGVAQIEVAHPDVSKALTLRFLAERDGLTRDDIMAAGDNFNDIDMLEYAGHPVVMGNAHAELKSMGYYVAPTNDEDGLAAVLAKVK